MSEKPPRLKDKLPSQVVSWLGILGGAMTIVGNLESVLSLSNWAHVLISNWSAWVRGAWAGILSVVGLNAPSDFVLAWWTLSLFIVATALGARLTGGKPGSMREVFRFSLSRRDIELFVLICLLVAMLALPTMGARTEGARAILLTGLPYVVAILVSLRITDTESLVRRMRLVVGVIVLALVLNWVSALLLPAST